MKREHLADLSAFATVAHELSFTRAASKLGMTQSSLSHAIRRLEGRLLMAAEKRGYLPGSEMRVLRDERDGAIGAGCR
jgi:DNA-binding transcriptional ArsR family regulator